MAIPVTTLPEQINNGQNGELADTAAAYKAINAITAALTGSGNADTRAIRDLLTLTGPSPLTAAGGQFRADGQIVRLSGWNLYDAVVTDNIPGQAIAIPPIAGVEAQMDAGKALGHNSVRIHTLFINYGKPGTIMPTLGVYNEAVLVQADKVIAAARVRKLWIKWPVTDRWNFFHGGAWSFVMMSLGDQSLTQSAALGIFYGTSGTATQIAKVRADFEAYITTLMNRVNTVTGIRWKDDPTVAIGQTGNEVWDMSAARHATIARLLKTIAPTRLVADGSAASGDTIYTRFHMPIANGGSGGETNADIDIVGAHFYNDHDKDVDQLAQQAAWAAAAGKIYMADEYDWRRSAADQGSARQTTTTPEQWYAALEKYAQGDMWWCSTGPDTAGHNDGYQLQILSPQNPTQLDGRAQIAAHALRMTSGGLAQIADSQIPVYFPAFIDRTITNQPPRTPGLRAGRIEVWIGGTGDPDAGVDGDVALDLEVAAPVLSTMVFDGRMEGLTLVDGAAITATNTAYSTPNVGGGTNSITYITSEPVSGTASARLFSADGGAVCTLGKAAVAGAPLTAWAVLLDFRISKLPDTSQVILRGYNDTAFTAAQSSFSTVMSAAGALVIQCGVGAAAGTELTLPAATPLTAGVRYRLQVAGIVASNALSVKLDNGPGTTAIWSQTVTPATGHEVSQVTGGRFGWGNSDANSVMIGEMSIGSGNGFLAA